MTKLIIIRGPSGVGKSTVAKALMKRTQRPTVLVDLDHYRFSFVNPLNHDQDLEYAIVRKVVERSSGRKLSVLLGREPERDA